jgi:hypothetical protein
MPKAYHPSGDSGLAQATGYRREHGSESISGKLTHYPCSQSALSTELRHNLLGNALHQRSYFLDISGI